MKVKRSKSLLCMLLSLALLFGMLPTVVLAEETGEASVEAESGGSEGSSATLETTDENTETKEDSTSEDTSESESSEGSDETSENGQSPEGASEENTTYTNSIKGIIWLDENEDGIFDSSESPVSEYVVSLYKASDTDNAVATVRTDSNGEYVFDNISPDDYKVGVPLSQTVNGTEYLVPMVGISGDNKFKLDETTYNAYTDTITIAADTQATDYSAGVRLPAVAVPMSANYYYVYNGSGGLINTATTLSAAVALCTGSGTGSYTIKLSEDDNDMGTNVVTIPDGYDITLTSYSSTTCTIKQTAQGSSFTSFKHLYVASGGSLTLDNIILSAQGYTLSAAVSNGGVYVESGGKLIMENGATIKSCADAYYSGVTLIGTVSTPATLVMKNGATIKECSGNSGGGVYAQYSNIIMDGATIDTCSTQQGAGSVSAQFSNITMNGTTIKNCTGSGVAAGYSDITMDGGTIENCISTGRGAGISLGGSDSTRCTLEMKNGAKIDTCTSSYAYGGGGGVFAAYTDITMDGVTIENCKTSSSSGGGLYATYSDIIMDGTTIDNCTASSTGGGLYAANSDIIMDGTTIKNCKAENGGGVNATYSDITMDGAAIENCEATYGGGGVYMYDIESDPGTLVMRNGAMIKDCTSGAGGGGVRAWCTNIIMDNALLEGCTCGYTINGTQRVGGGGSVYLTGGSSFTCTLEIKNGTQIKDSTSGAYGGGVYASYTNIIMDNATIQDISAYASGGGIYLTNGDITINNSTIQDITGATISGYTGGGMHVANGNITMSGVTIENCTTNGSGGGVYVTGGDLAMSGSTKIGTCTSSNGTGGGVYIANGDMTMDGTTIENCITSSNGGNGGGVYILGTAASPLTLKMKNGAIIKDCTVSGSAGGFSGGGVYASYTDITMDDASIENCTSTSSGGGIYIFGNSTTPRTLKMNNGSTIKDCTTTSYTAAGGGIWARYIDITMDDSNIQNCKAINTDTNTSSSGYGGGVYLYTGTLELYGGMIQDCETTRYGGGVYAASSDITMDGVTIENCTVSNITVGGIGECAGGGVYTDSGDLIMDNVTIQSCTVSATTNSYGRGGGVYAGSGDNVTMANVTIQNCAATSSYGGGGGGVYLNGGTFEMQNGIKIENCNTSYTGGGVYVKGTITMDGTTIIDTCTADTGGGAYATTTITMDGATIQNCTAISNGGGVFFVTGLVMDGATIQNCDAGISGGGVYVYSSATSHAPVEIKNGSKIQDCTAGTSGGGVYSWSAALTMDGASIIDTCTTTSGSGGGVYSTYTMTMDGATIQNCNATSGGGVYGSLEMKNGATIQNSTASSAGGGVNSSSLDMSSGAIIQNCNAATGGGVYNRGTVTMDGTSIIDTCTADNNGGGVYVYSSGTLTMDGATIQNCDASISGGGVYIYGNTNTFASVEMKNGAAIQNCKAINNSGGGVYAYYYGNITMDNATIQNCTASDSGGGVYIIGTAQSSTIMGALEMNNGATIDSNIAANGSGGGIYLNGSNVSLTAVSGSITNNSALNGDGGGIYTTEYNYVYPVGLGYYGNVSTTGSVTFSGNTAQIEDEPPSDALTNYGTQLDSNGTSQSGLQTITHILNNYDLNYKISPVVVTNAATDVTGFSATLNGEFNISRFTLYGVYIEYSTDSTMATGVTTINCTSLTTPVSQGVGTLPDQAYVSGTSLEPDTKYYYRVCIATNYNGGTSTSPTSTYGNIESFTTARYHVFDSSTFVETFVSAEYYLKNAVGDTAAGSPYTIYALTNDADIGSNAATGNKYVTIPANYDITLTSYGSNNYTLTQTATITSNSYSQRHFYVASGSSLKLESITLSGIGNTASPYNGGIYVCSGGELSMDRNAVIKDCNSIYGGGVYFDSSTTSRSTLIMTDGATIENCTASSFYAYTLYGYGGGVYASNIDITMDDATIKDCTASAGIYYGANGGGVYVAASTNASTLIMDNGASIDNCTASTSSSYAAYGGGVYLSGTLEMNDGATIKDCIATSDTRYTYGGGVYLSGTLEMNDGATIQNCSATSTSLNYGGYGGGVYLSSGTFDMNSGSKVENCDADSYGGGVYAYYYTSITMDAAAIQDCTAASGGGAAINAYLRAFAVNSTLEMKNGAKIDNNTATTGDGGGIYLINAYAALTATSGSITNNSAPNGNGGGIYTDDYNYDDPVGTGYYSNVSTTSAVAFSGNSAVMEFEPPSDIVTSNYDTQLASSSTSQSSTAIKTHILNNYDVNYRRTNVNLIYNSNVSAYSDSTGGTMTDSTTTAEVYNVGTSVTVKAVDDTTIDFTTRDSTVPPGYEFDGWNTQADGLGTSYDPGDSFTINSNTVLYAKWKKIESSITIEKYGDQDGTTKLAGAQFTVERETSPGTWEYYKYDTGSGSWVTTVNKSESVITTTSTGDITLSDLPDGTYRFTEVAPPASGSGADYTTLMEAFEVTVPLVTSSDYTSTYTGSWQSDGTDYYYYNLTYTVTDTAALYMPDAGSGLTPIMYLMLGLSIAAIAVAYVMIRRRKTLKQQVKSLA